jgi:hypothetical protein
VPYTSHRYDIFVTRSHRMRVHVIKTNFYLFIFLLNDLLANLRVRCFAFTWLPLLVNHHQFNFHLHFLLSLFNPFPILNFLIRTLLFSNLLFLFLLFKFLPNVNKVTYCIWSWYFLNVNQITLLFLHNYHHQLACRNHDNLTFYLHGMMIKDYII